MAAHFVCIGLVVMVIQAATEGKHCSPTAEFRCANENCVSLDRVNNTVNDCGDNSDEASVPCKSPLFSCRNNRCALMSWVLDGNNDCLDGSDEAKLIGTSCESAVSCCFCHHYVPNSDCIDGFCRCLAGYYANELLNNCFSRAVGDHCTTSDDCLVIHNGTCNSVESKCACVDGFRPINNGLTCIERQLGEHCTLDTDCPLHSRCDSANSTCSCDTENAFYQQPSGVCEKPVIEKVTECISAVDCSPAVSDAHTVVCIDGSCRCAYGYVEVESGYDVIKNVRGFFVYRRRWNGCRLRRIHDACDVTSLVCSDVITNSHCEEETGICTCLDGFLVGSRNSTCVRLGARCHPQRSFDECSDVISGSTCDANRMSCNCDVGYGLIIVAGDRNGTGNEMQWCARRPLGGRCLETDDCAVPSSHCAADQSCACVKGWYPVDADDETKARCVRRRIGDTGCRESSDCVIESGDCFNGTCRCLFGFREMSPYACTKRLLDDDVTLCSDHSYCSSLFPNTICASAVLRPSASCQCVSGFRIADNRTECVRRHRLATTGSDGDVTTAFEPPCRDDADCSDSLNNSRCADESRRCVCDTGYYVTVSGGGVEPDFCSRRLIGDECIDTDDCSLIERAGCRNGSEKNAVCVCDVGFGHTRDRMQCRKRRIGRIDDDVSECLSNADCSVAVEFSVCRTGQCQCRVGYEATDFGDRCKLRELGAVCLVQEDCTVVIPFSVCDVIADEYDIRHNNTSSSSVCLCRPGFREANDTTSGPPYCRPFVVGDDCHRDIDCSLSVPFSRCINHTCLCSSGYRTVTAAASSGSNSSQTLCARRMIGDQCEENLDCSDAVTFSECDVTQYSCQCDEEHQPEDNGTVCAIRPTLAPFLPAEYPDWTPCDLAAGGSSSPGVQLIDAGTADATTHGTRWPTSSCGSESTEICLEEQPELVTSLSSSGWCMCRGGYARRQPFHQCTRVKTYELRLNCSYVAGRFELLPLNYEEKNTFKQWMLYADRLLHNGIDVTMDASSLTNESYISSSVLAMADARPGLLVTIAVHFDLNSTITAYDVEIAFQDYFNRSQGEIGTSRIYVDNITGWQLTDLDECSSQNTTRRTLNDCDPRATCGNLPGYFYCVCNLDYNDNSTDEQFSGRLCVAIDKEKVMEALEKTFRTAGCSDGVCQTQWDEVLIMTSSVFSVLLLLLTIELIWRTRQLRRQVEKKMKKKAALSKAEVKTETSRSRLANNSIKNAPSHSKASYVPLTVTDSTPDTIQGIDFV